MFSLLFTTGYLILATATAHAEELTSEKFIIKMGNINIGSGSKTGATIKLTDSLGQNAPGEFEATGYRLKSGFAYLPTKDPFGFIVGKSSIDFGTLFPNTFYRNQISLTVNGVGVQGYRVSLIENHPLALESGQTFIPDTTCDPSQVCTSSIASPWTSTTSYGFGYNMAGDDVDSADFVDSSYYRPLSNNAKGESPTSVMSRQKRGRIATASATFAINISPTQPNGIYENTVQFIALPSY